MLCMSRSEVPCLILASRGMLDLALYYYLHKATVMEYHNALGYEGSFCCPSKTHSFNQTFCLCRHFYQLNTGTSQCCTQFTYFDVYV